jgi:uncharacterized hydantoinase/oxoprolinase family protein
MTVWIPVTKTNKAGFVRSEMIASIVESAPGRTMVGLVNGEIFYASADHELLVRQIERSEQTASTGQGKKAPKTAARKARKVAKQTDAAASHAS